MRPILIDLTISELELREICSELKISYDFLISEKALYNLEKVYIDLDTFKMFAYKVVGSDELFFTDAAKIVWDSIKSYRIDSYSELNSDVILEKISANGFDSLSKDEKEYLKNLSKS